MKIVKKAVDLIGYKFEDKKWEYYKRLRGKRWP